MEEECKERRDIIFDLYDVTTATYFGAQLSHISRRSCIIFDVPSSNDINMIALITCDGGATLELARVRMFAFCKDITVSNIAYVYILY
jgi:hypothetical protein